MSTTGWSDDGGGLGSERQRVPGTGAPDPGRAVAEMVAIEHERYERAVRVVFTVGPLPALGCAGWLAWGGTLRLISASFPAWVLASLALLFGVGVALTGSVLGGLTGLLWGGAVRIFLVHHTTFSINSLCHFFGRAPFSTGDESRNLAWLAPITFGEAWHNNHHAFPTSARHGLGRRQPDPGAWLIAALDRLHLAWDVVRISSERQRAKRLAIR